MHLVSASALRAAPNLSIGQFLTWVDRGTTIALAISVVAACTALGVGPLPAVAVAVGLVMSPVLAPALNVPTVSFVLACLAAGAAANAHRRAATTQSRPGSKTLWVPLALAATTAPPLAPALAVTAAAIVWTDARTIRRHRTALAFGLAVGLVLAAGIVSFAVPPGHGTPDGAQALRCVLPLTNPAAVDWLLPWHVLQAVGPFAVALAVVPILSRATIRVRTGAPWAFAVTAALAAANAPAAIATAPGVLLVWLLAACGIETIVSGWPARKRIAAGLCIVAIVPGVQSSRTWLSEVVAPGIPSAGHEKWSLADLQQLTSVLPLDAAIVREDAAFDLLRRTQRMDRRRDKPMPEVTRSPDAVERAAAGHAVFLLPVAQRELEARGVAWRPAALWDHGAAATNHLIGSMARVESVRPCRPLDTRWTDVTVAATDALLVLVASRDDARSRVLLLVGGRELDPGPVRWPADAADAFSLRTLLHPIRGGASTIADQLRADRAPVNAFTGVPHVVRLEFWRTEFSPLTLAIRLGGRVSIALARLEEPAPKGSTEMLCPSTGRAPLSSG